MTLVSLAGMTRRDVIAALRDGNIEPPPLAESAIGLEAVTEARLADGGRRMGRLQS